MSEVAASGAKINNTPVAFFDFDGTLTTCDTLMPFLKFVVGKPKYYWNLLLVSPVLAGYFLKLVRNDIAKEAVLKRYLAGYPIDDLFALGERFSKEVIPNLLRAEGIERLRWHQEQGHESVLVSASLDIWLEPWAKKNSFTSIITTELELYNSIITGKIKNKNCYGIEKKIRIKKWLFNKKPMRTYAYGDTAGDIQMLSIVDEGWMINRKKKVTWKKYINNN